MNPSPSHRLHAPHVPALPESRFWVLAGLLLALMAPPLSAATYYRSITTFSWIAAGSHTRVTETSSPYRFTNGSGCGTTLPVLDDSISNAIPIGFTFRFGTVNYTQAYIQTNGRIQFGNTTCGFGTQNIGPPQTYPYTPFPDGSMNAVMKIYGADLDPTPYTAYPSGTTQCGGNSNPNCYISFATLGTAPNRQFVVTWNNVPEWISASSSTGNFNLQAILNENGSFVYQFGVNVQPSTSERAETGWQLSGSDYDSVSVGQIQPNNSALLFSTTAPPTLHHLELSAPTATGLTCLPTTLTIRACANAACTTPYTLGVSGIINTAGSATVNWEGGIGSLSIPAGSSSITKNIQVITPNSPEIISTSVTPTPVSGMLCNLGGSTSCQFTAAAAGFALSFSPSALTAETTGGLRVSAVRQSDNSLACVPAFASVSKPVTFTCSYLNPTSGTLPIRLNGSVPLAAGLTSACSGTGASINVAFDANGSASLPIIYADAGQMRVNASFTGTSGTEANLSLTGSASVVSAPAGFGFSAIRQTAAPNRANPAAADASGGAFVRAGETFSATVTALNALGNATANFGRETTPASVTLSSTLIAPTGGATGTFSGALGSFNAGAATAANLNWTEIGIIGLTARLSNDNYLGSGLAPSGSSGNVGRFIPDHFTLASASLVPRIDNAGCATSGFNYLGEPARLNFRLQALNAGNGITTNYDTARGYSKLNGAGADWLARGSASSLGLGAVDKPVSPASSTTLNTRLAMVPSAGAASGSWNAGIGDFTGYFAVQRAAAPDGPYSSVKLGIYPTDADGITAAAVNLDTDLNGSNDRIDLGITTLLRFGRIHILNAYGSELLPLAVPVYAEHYAGSGFAVNAADSCTGLALTPSASSAPTSYRWGDLTLGNPQRNLAVDSTQPGTAANPLTLAGGSALVLMSAPGTGKDGSLDLTLTVPAWLQYDWNGDGGYADAPTGRAVFGIYKGNIIDQRENY